jgi:putative Holliday junction resolvase
MDDSVGSQAKTAIAWATELAKRANLPLTFVDERLSSFQAEQDLIERKRGGERLTRQMKKERLDAIAAAGFLQAFLDGRLMAINLDEL